jgi:hypothetical protein
MIAFAASAQASTENGLSYSASAFDLDSGEPLYTETHTEIWSEGRLHSREVRYAEPDGDLIAEKVVRYGMSPEAPSFEMIDHRLGRKEGAQVESSSITLFHGPIDGGSRTREVERPSTAVVDAGFDAFMRERFDSVLAGERIEFDFAVPALRRFFRFELLPKGEISYDGGTAVLVKMRPASALLRLAVDPVDLIYSRSGRLLEFRGLSNMADGSGERYKARIVFDYPESLPPAFAAGAAP